MEWHDDFVLGRCRGSAIPYIAKITEDLVARESIASCYNFAMFGGCLCNSQLLGCLLERGCCDFLVKSIEVAF